MKIDLKTQSNSEMNIILNQINEDSDFKELYNKNENNIYNLFIKYIYLNPNKKYDENENSEAFKKESIAIIQYLVSEYFKESLNIYEEQLNYFLREYTEDITKKLGDFQTEFNRIHENLLDEQRTSSSWEDIIKQKLYEKLNKKAKLFALKNSFKFITEPLIEKFGEYFIGSYLYRLENNKDKIIEIVQGTYEKIEEKIKEYELLKKQQEEKEKEKDKANYAKPKEENLEKAPTSETKTSDIDFESLLNH
jgi:hypothetical protein